MLKQQVGFTRRALLMVVAGVFSGAAMPLDIYQGPLVAERSMDPNVVYIHDDSGSMRDEYMPEEAPSGGNLRKAAFINKQYYNPDLTYQPPLKYVDGKLVSWGNMDQRCKWPEVLSNGFSGLHGAGNCKPDKANVAEAEATRRSSKEEANRSFNAELVLPEVNEDGDPTGNLTLGGFFASTLPAARATYDEVCMNQNWVSPIAWQRTPGFAAGASFTAGFVLRNGLRSETDVGNPGNYGGYNTDTHTDRDNCWAATTNAPNDGTRISEEAWREARDAYYLVVNQPNANLVAAYKMADEEYTLSTSAQTTMLDKNSAVYYDYVPGFNSRIDNPTYKWDPIVMINGKQKVQVPATGDGGYALGEDWTSAQWKGGTGKTAPEHVIGNYESYNFVQPPGGRVFYEGGSSQVNHDATWNRWLVENRACPVLFKDVPESRAYYHDPVSPAADGGAQFQGNPHAQCRYSYRTGDVDFPSNYQFYDWTAPWAGKKVGSLPAGRRWCRRTNNSENFFQTGIDRSCVMGKHLIGDTTGYAVWDNGKGASNSTPGARVSHYDPSADITTMKREAKIAANQAFNDGLAQHMLDIQAARDAYDDFCENYKWKEGDYHLKPGASWPARWDWGYNLTLPAGNNFVLSRNGSSGSGNVQSTIPANKIPLSDNEAKEWGRFREGGIDLNNKPNNNDIDHSSRHLLQEWCFSANTQQLNYRGSLHPTYKPGDPRRKSTAQFNQAVADYKAVVNRLNAKLRAAYDAANAMKSSIDQSLEHRVSTFIDDSGNLVTEAQPRTRTAKEEIRNFSNWYAYYRTRHLAAKSGLSLAFGRLVNRDNTTQPSLEMNGKSIRLGYDTLANMKMGTGNGVGPGAGGDNVVVNGRGPVPFLDFPSDAKKADGTPHPYHDQKFVRDFYSWVQALPIRSGTPLRNALNTVGQYYASSDRAWVEYPPVKFSERTAPGGGGQLFGCRRAFTILMTDGYYTDGSRSPANGDVDKVPGPVIWRTDIDNKPLTGDKYRYQYPGGTAARPFFGENPGSTVSGSLADIAMYYWNRDLRPDIPNMTTPTKKDPAFWQHMQTFTIGLGVQGRMSDAEVNQFLAKGSNKNILWTYPSGLDTDYEKIDDLMHAGLNGHAGTAAAEDAGEFAGKLAGLLAEISGQVGSNTSPAAPRVLDEDAIVVTSSYDPSDWSGEVYGNNICLKGSAQCGSKFAATVGSAWSAGSALAERINKKGHQDRNIVTYDGSWAVPFTTGNLSGAIKSAMDVKLEHIAGTPESCIMVRPNAGDPVNGGDACLLHKGQADEAAYNVDHLINYLRGEQKYEDSTTGTTVNYNGFRRRSYTDSDGFQQVKLLGDIVNSSPALVTAEDFGWNRATALEAKPTTGKSAAELYAERLTESFTKNAKGKWVVDRSKVYESVLVGAGDGMLHNFDAETGEENFAFIPQAVHPILKKLGDPQYALIPTLQHSFYVDGATVVRDALLGGKWQRVAVGSTGRSDGGHSYFAINVEDTSSFNARDVLWEFTNSNLGAPANGRAEIAVVDEGSKPQTGGGVSDPDLKWYAIFGNGYNSGSNEARLFLVDLATGHLARSISAPGNSTKPNGLGTPSLVGAQDGTSILAYAGDLQGNLWKFDLREGKAYKLLEATNPNGKPQIITAAPRITITGGDKIQVTVGTGKFLSQADVDTTDVQTIYSVRDQCGTGAPACNPPTAIRSALYPITWKNGGKMLTSTATDANGNVSVQQGWVMDTFDAAQQTALKDGTTQGFYLDLTASGMEGGRVIDMPSEGLLGMGAGNILVPVVLPVSNPCGSSDSGIAVELDPNGGAPKKSQMFKTVEGMNVTRLGDGRTIVTSGGGSGGIGGNQANLGTPPGQPIIDPNSPCVWVGAKDPMTGDPIIDEKTGQQRMECIPPIKPGTKKGRQSWRQLR
ncbi:hypothetical protein AGMMS49545_06570 [Betaproteobacteria bacterium]|nr:hypothetical protein AGMMS49545_06570 [Betaproteobacteria bacterium]GHU44860.1 hypothetical protein AGMMS50289_14260 [Betaproteobacteria bacterium]